jgi:hypothetical protein
MGLRWLDCVDDYRESFKYGQSADRKKDPHKDFYV